MRILFLTIASLFFVPVYSQQTTDVGDRPKLMVGIVVDQMRQEYLYRYYQKFGDGGFKRLMTDGFMLKNAHYNYTPTRTAPGHASIYTGSTPGVHGIIGNDWYDKNLRQKVYCVTDPNQKAVGTVDGKGDVSPWRLLTTTVADELKLFTQKKSKVIGISLKDRGAVLPVGHTADAAYWFDSKSGSFITSTFYRTSLPEWLTKFNAKKLPDQYLAQEWKTLYPIEQYVESGPDDNPYETKLWGKEKPTFPYNLKTLRKKGDDYDMLQYVPFGNDIIVEMVRAAMDGEKIGQGATTDFLAISFSAPDKLGHEVGPNSVEEQDMYLRLDKNVEQLIQIFDEKVGAGNYTLFLTADHAIPDIAQYMKDSRVPAGYFNSGYIKAKLNEHLQKYFPGKDLVEAIDNEQIFFNQQAFQSDPKSSGVELLVATELSINFLLSQEGIANAYSEAIIRQGRYDEGGAKGMAIRGYHPKRSGDIVIVLAPGWYEGWKVTSTDHGTSYTYDTHVPVLFFGKGIRKGSSVRYHSITDVAPTVSVLLSIRFPNGCTGQPIPELFEK